MFHLSDAQLEAAARWDPIEPGFSRDDGWPYGQRLSLLVRALQQRHWLGVSVDADGGLENYAHVFVYESPLFPRRAESEGREGFDYEGFSIYLSLLGPYAAIGPTRKYMRYELAASGQGIGIGAPAKLALSNVTSTPGDNTVLQAAFNETTRIGYRVLQHDELGQPLPGGVEPMDVCGLPDGPFTYFDLLFNETD